MKSYFDDEAAAEKLREEALKWVGAPFGEFYSKEEVDPNRPVPPRPPDARGSVDCIGLLQEIFTRIGASEEFVFKRESADYQSHQLGDKVLQWLRGEMDDPQSKRLAEILTELEIPDAFNDPNAKAPRDFFKPGDILVMQHHGLFHLPVLIDRDLHFVNALPRLGVMEGTIQDATYRRYLVAAFRLKPKE
jgi:hypothetical protein